MSRLVEAAQRIQDGTASLDDFILVGQPDEIIIEILGQEYGGGDHRRAVVANRIGNALRKNKSLKEAPK
jgi:RecA/RadA recombinase